MLTLKLIHVTCAMITTVDFFARGLLMMRDSPWLQNRYVKTLPHVNDTILLVSAAMLAMQMGVSVLSAPWLLAKIIALFVYIGLGLVALRYGKTRKIKVTAWCLAMLVLFYLIAVAVTKSPLLFFT